MAAKMELEAYINDDHPHPQYLRHHIFSCSETLAKQANVEGTQLVSDGFPQETTTKAIYSTTLNGHTNMDTVTHPYVKSGTVLCFRLFLVLSFYSLPKHFESHLY